MSSTTKRKLFVAARIFTACATFLLLTMAVMQRADQDGYQATHLFFTPRQNWEMDEGRGMLHEEEYYRNIDAQALAEEMYGWEPGVQRENAGQESQVLLHPDHEDWRSAYHGPSSTLRRAPYIPNFSTNETPVAGAFEVLLPNNDQLSTSGERSFYFGDWQPDIPSPPPRTA